MEFLLTAIFLLLEYGVGLSKNIFTLGNKMSQIAAFKHKNNLVGSAKIIFSGFALLLLAGCHTAGSLKAGDSGETFEVTNREYNEIWSAALITTSSQLTIIESNKDQGVIKAEKGVGLTTWGEVAGVFINPPQEGAEKYSVNVQSLKRSALQITGQNWTKTLVEGIKARLGL